MRYFIRLVLICCGVVFLAHAAAAQSPWYLSGSAGIFLRSDSTKSTTISNATGTSGPGTNTSTFDPGPIVNLGVGYRLPFGFRIEGEVGYEHYASSSVDPFSSNGAFPNLIGNRLEAQSGGNRDGYSATINAFYDFPVSGRFVPYAGVGVGVVHGVSQTGIFAGPGVPKFTGRGDTVNYAIILAEIGVTIAIDQKWAVVPSYRYEHGFVTGPVDANILKVGLRYSF